MDKYTTWQLAGMADCASPDRHDGIGFDHPTEPAEGSAGADFLRRVARDTAEKLAWREDNDAAEDLDDMAHEVADGCVPIYTHDLWATFTDLAAWQEDVGELAGDETDMDKLARVALYLIGERLAGAIIADRADDEDGEVDA